MGARRLVCFMVVMLLAVSTVLLPGCAKKTGDARSEIVTIGLDGEADGLDPRVATSRAVVLLGNAYEPLVVLPPTRWGVRARLFPPLPEG